MFQTDLYLLIHHRNLKLIQNVGGSSVATPDLADSLVTTLAV